MWLVEARLSRVLLVIIVQSVMRGEVPASRLALSPVKGCRAPTGTRYMDKLSSDRLAESSAAVRARVERAGEAQRKRFASVHAHNSLTCDADRGPV
jgi:hypothetical protein